MLDHIYTFHRRMLTLGFYPSSLKSFLTFFIVVVGSDLAGYDLTHGFASYVKPLIWYRTMSDKSFRGLCIRGVTVWLFLCYTRKFILKQALLYRGWMYEGKRLSTKSKVVLATIKLLNGMSRPLTKNLYALQGILPSLPVPPLRESVRRCLESVQSLVDEEEKARLEKLAADFLEGIGPKLQRCLILKSWIFPNYISDWWEKYVYLAQRSSLLISSNYYCMESLENATTQQAAKSACIAHWCLKIRKNIEDNTLEPVLGQDIIPLCTWQYERMWNTNRIPGIKEDSLQHRNFSNHFVVLHKGRYFKINAYHDDDRKKIVSLPELQLQFQRILSDNSKSTEGEDKLAALTAWDRVNWAKTRRRIIADEGNRQSLDAIETSAFIICLDDEEYSFDIKNKDTTQFESYARALFHGNGHNRWLDKSINFVIGTNGRAGAHCEHSWGDAPIGCHTWEICLRAQLDFEGFDEQGNIALPICIEPPHPERLLWKFSEDTLNDIRTAAYSVQSIIGNVDLKILPFMDFGRGAMKNRGVSPDAFIQMALQLAFFRNQGKFGLTYEATMTRLYLQGRTETVRSCTAESSDWVLAMHHGDCKEKQIKLFKRACDRHQNNYREAMNGKGIDRHFLGLYILSKYFKWECGFLEKILGMPWRLSTSQTPVSQTKLKPPMCPGGGFGPTAEDGYGVSYIFTGEDMLFFHVTSYRSCSKTDSRTFTEEIYRALHDIQSMF